MNDKFLQPYNPQETEGRIYKIWEESGLFNPDVCIEKGFTKADAQPFSIVLPPPNVTGRLHLGHALEHSLQDTIVRFKRMRGNKTLWIPGTDHAAIATQSRFEKNLYAKDKKSRHDFSRDEFFNMVQEFGLSNQKDMQKQMRLLGSSLDWSREAFTLDEKRSIAVRTAFKKMYDEGLIYRGPMSHATDNALMIAAAGYLNFLKSGPTTEAIKAQGNLSL
jgi:valyl-tRNA synthetase